MAHFLKKLLNLEQSTWRSVAPTVILPLRRLNTLLIVSHAKLLRHA